MSTPEVSVVMSVFNGANALPATLDSVLSQQGCDFEFIVIDDGSTDQTGRLLDERAAQDPRLRVIHQSNTGLTRALMRGCALAQGEFIARQDCGDLSLPSRLASQVQALRGDTSVVMVCCGVRVVGPGDEFLHDIISPGDELHEKLSRLDIGRIEGPPHHGGTMFRRADYLAVGGYRTQFTVAQDMDLWLRLAERGRCVGQAEVAYVARLDAGSISGRRRVDQRRLASLAIDCTKARRAGATDRALLDGLATQADHTPARQPSARSERARFYYFIGSRLRLQDPAAARRYFAQALRERPFFLPALFRMIWG